MSDLKNERVWISRDLIQQLRIKYFNETKNMTTNTMINWLLSNLVLLEENVS